MPVFVIDPLIVATIVFVSGGIILVFYVVKRKQTINTLPSALETVKGDTKIEPLLSDKGRMLLKESAESLNLIIDVESEIQKVLRRMREIEREYVKLGGDLVDLEKEK